MANLSDLFGGTGGGSITYDPLPTFALWSNYGNSPSFSVIDSSWGRINSGQYNTDGEIYSSNTGMNYTNSTIGTASYAASYTGGMTCFQQAEGHWVVNPPSNGNFNAVGSRKPNYLSGHWPFFGVTVGEYGIRQKNSLYVSDTTMRTYSRGSTTFNESFNWTSYANNSGAPGNTTRGMIGYNYNTNTLVVLASGGGQDYRVHIWTHPNYKLDGSDVTGGSILKFVSEAYAGTNGASYKYNSIVWNTSSFGSYTESQYHLRVIVGDNNQVGLVRFTPSNQTVHGVFTIGANGSTPTVTTQRTLSNTTSYGIEQGNYYGLRHNISWDNKWVISYAPYYYYGCGAKVFVTSTENPSRFYYYNYDSTSHGVGISPFGESGFVFSPHENNADGDVGHYVGVFDPKRFTEAGNTSDTSFSVSYGSHDFDCNYTSTNYPWLLPMSSFNGGIEKY